MTGGNPRNRGLTRKVTHTLSLDHNGQLIEGTARGIDPHGGLLMELEDGRLQAFHSGEVSIGHA